MPDSPDRPYRQFLGADLEAFAVANWDDLVTLNAINAELLHRSTVRLPSRVNARIAALIHQGFAWPQTDAAPTGADTPLVIDAPQTGLLKFVGYTVGESGISLEDRKQILDSVYSQTLPQVNSQSYMDQWGRPASALRLHKMADSIAAFTRQQKRKSNPPLIAISDWEYDLEYLRVTYYVGRYDFTWPQTDGA